MSYVNRNRRPTSGTPYRRDDSPMPFLPNKSSPLTSVQSADYGDERDIRDEPSSEFSSSRTSSPARGRSSSSAHQTDSLIKLLSGIHSANRSRESTPKRREPSSDESTLTPPSVSKIDRKASASPARMIPAPVLEPPPTTTAAQPPAPVREGSLAALYLDNQTQGPVVSKLRTSAKNITEIEKPEEPVRKKAPSKSRSSSTNKSRHERKESTVGITNEPGSAPPKRTPSASDNRTSSRPGSRIGSQQQNKTTTTTTGVVEQHEIKIPSLADIQVLSKTEYSEECSKGNDAIGLLKICFIGPVFVGKTCIVMRIRDDEFLGDSKPTIGIDFVNQTLKHKGKCIKMQVWDTAGNEKYKSITRAYYRGTHGLVMVFDLTDRRTLEDGKMMLQEAMKEAASNPLVCIIGNKCDLTTSRQVSTKEMEQFTKELNYHYFETSALTGYRVKETFLLFSKDIIEQRMARGFLQLTAPAMTGSGPQHYITPRGTAIDLSKTKTATAPLDSDGLRVYSSGGNAAVNNNSGTKNTCSC